MMRRYGQMAVFSILLIHAAPGLSSDYLIAESTDFTGNGCENTNLNNITSSFEDALLDDGWTGNRHANGNT